ncbi:hypothetical protein ACX12M_13750 [Cellulosimicrobium cellulans]
MRTRLTITKTTTALATSALLVLGLAACGGSGDDASTDAETTPAEETSAPADEETTATEEPAEEESGDTEASGDFCTAFTSLSSSQSALADATSDPTAAAAALDDLATTLESAEAPAEISADWDTLSGFYRQIADVAQSAVDDPANADTSALMDVLGDESLTTSVQNIGVYAGQNC